MKTSKKFLAALCAFAGLAAYGADSIVVDEGTYEPTSMSAGTNEIASLTVRSGAKLVIPAGVVIKPTTLVVESGAIFGGAGRLLYPVSSSELAGLVLEDAVSIDDGRSSAVFSVDVYSGNPEMAVLGDDSILIFDTNATIRVTGSGVLDVLVVGGGGGGGAKSGGGGGGGGVIYTQTLAVASGVYSVSVGRGGIGAPDKSAFSTSGGDSGVFGLVAYGGGAGGTYQGTYNDHKGLPGGSGGGGGIEYAYSSTLKAPGGSGVVGQGYDGGKGCNTNYKDYGGDWGSSWAYCAGGGGGGAGGAGTDALYDHADGQKLKGGNGGNGVLCEIYGSKYYGGGGGGGTTHRKASGCFLGGLGGGGRGGVLNNSAQRPEAGVKGEDGLGGGGGGGSMSYLTDPEGGAGGNGGSGVVILRWRRAALVDGDLPDGIISTGGTVRRKNGYVTHTFDMDGAFVLSEPAFADILLVGGGGGGGALTGGGGGGGGVVIVSNIYLTAGSYPVTVGAGGAGAAGRSTSYGSNGADTVFSFRNVYSLKAIGGGGGATVRAGKSGGSGGGGGAPYVTSQDLFFSGGEGTLGQGYAGGKGIHNYTGDVNNDWSTAQGGGGGGAGAPGGDATTGVPGNGGDGVMCDFSGTNVCYGGGGGGGTATYSYDPQNNHYTAAGGLGGGGRGGSAYTPWPNVRGGENGTDGLGGGGGGSGGTADNSSAGGDGGSGVVIIRYRIRKPGFMLIFE